MTHNQAETRVATIGLEEDGILRVTAHPGMDVDLADVQEIIRVQAELTGGKMVRFLLDLRSVRSVTREVLRSGADKELTKYTIAAAYLVSSPASTFIANLLLKMSNPSHPTRVFSSEEEGIKWLEQFQN